MRSASLSLPEQKTKRPTPSAIGLVSVTLTSLVNGYYDNATSLQEGGKGEVLPIADVRGYHRELRAIANLHSRYTCKDTLGPVFRAKRVLLSFCYLAFLPFSYLPPSWREVALS